MFLGELIFSSADIVYSPIVPRPALAAAFTFQVTQISTSGSPSLAITIEHRNNDETSFSTAVALAAITSISSVDTYAATVANLRDLVRIKYVMSGTNTWARVFTFTPAPQ